MVGQLGAAADRCPQFFLVIQTVVTAGGNPKPLPIVSRLSAAVLRFLSPVLAACGGSSTVCTVCKHSLLRNESLPQRPA